MGGVIAHSSACVCVGRMSECQSQWGGSGDGFNTCLLMHDDIIFVLYNKT